jgi:hypothetical protein
METEVEAEIRVSTIVVEVMGGSKITIPVVVLRVISIMGMPSPISVRIHKIPNLGIQALVLVLPARSATSLDIQRLIVINA